MGVLTVRKFYPLKMYVLDNLANQRLSCSNPKNFNDPFDCKLKDDKIICSALDKDQIELINQMHVLCTFEVGNKKDVDEFNKIQRYFWSFYGDSHKGVCVEFDLPVKDDSSDTKGIFSFDNTSGFFDEKTDSFFSGRANYLSDYLKNLSTIIANTKRDSFSDVLRTIGFTKDDVFSNEREFRIINLGEKDNDDYSFFNIEKYKKRIIFGNRCNKGVRSMIKSALRGKFDSFYYVNDNLEEEKDV